MSRTGTLLHTGVLLLSGGGLHDTTPATSTASILLNGDVRASIWPNLLESVCQSSSDLLLNTDVQKQSIRPLPPDRYLPRRRGCNFRQCDVAT